MSSLQIDRVTGGFIVTTPTERGVACSVHALVAAVQVWATSEAMDYETTLACAAPPPVAPSNIGSVEMPPLTEDQQAYLQKIRNMPPPDLNTMIGTPCSPAVPCGGSGGAAGLEPDGSLPQQATGRCQQLDSGVSAIPNNGGHPVWFDFDELRHAPAEDL
jgi:hypothetical protein